MPTQPQTTAASPSDIFDMAIVGYGPVGQALALMLAQQGHSVVVFERWPHPYGLPRAVGLDHEAMRILQSIGVAEEFEARTQPAGIYEWRNGSNELLVAFPGMDRPAASGWAQMRSFSQPVLERLLDDRLREQHAGAVKLHRDMTVVSADDRGDYVALHARPTADLSQPVLDVKARYLVGCDGAGSFVREAIAARMEDIAFAADWLVVDLQPRDPARATNELVQICDPRRPTTMVAGGPGRRRFEFMMLEGERKEDFNNAAAAWQLLARWGWDPANAVLERHAVYTFRAAVADRWREGRLMIAGDAAHLTPPFAAQGLCAGLRDAAALAWRLDMVLRGRASEALLDSYALERRPHARALVEFAVELGAMICVLDPEAAAQRDQQMRSAGQRDDEKMPEPRLGASPLVRDEGEAAGRLGVQGRIRRFGRLGRFDDFFGPAFTLIGFGHDPADRLDAAQKAFLLEIGGRCVGIGAGCSVQDVDGTYRRWFQALETDAVMMRPDHYVFGSGDAATLTRALMSAWTPMNETKGVTP